MKINKNSAGYTVLISMLLISSVVSLKLFTQERTSHDKLDIHAFPLDVGGWKGRDLAITEKEYDILETRNLISRQYVNVSGDKLSLLIIYSETNRSVFHPPEVCLVGSGMAMVDKQVEMIGDDNSRFSTNKLFLEKDGYKEITLYSYKAGKLYTSNFYLQQLYLMLHQVFGRNVPGATLRVSMAVGRDGHETLVTLKNFMSESAVILDKLSR